MNLAIRPMQPADIKQVKEIDKQAFPTLETSISFKRELRNEIAKYIVVYEPGSDEEAIDTPGKNRSIINKTLSSITQFVLGPAPTKQNIVGFAGIWFMSGEAHLITIAVRDGYRGLSVGEYLVTAVIDTAIQCKAGLVTLEVRSSNTAAQSLYEKYGLYASGKRKHYYSDTKEDAIIMTTGDINAEEFQTPFQAAQKSTFKKICLSK